MRCCAMAPPVVQRKITPPASINWIATSRFENLSLLGRVLRITDFFKPLDRTSIQRFLNGDMGHCRVGRGTVPVLFARLEPHDVAGTDFFDRPIPALYAAEP